MAQQLKNPEEKISYYRKAAAEAEKNAMSVKDPEARNAYLAIMRTWIYLADELEREMSFQAASAFPEAGMRDERMTGRRRRNEARRSH